ncbi:MAG: hypothetical protein CMI05_12000 [Oceanospirillaceae bacterium]|nr:hypothetical protein [Oceanospirillaceae bacterium]|tara:strand:+ start:2470 stop:2967 length:498 start_codon:yes stop_codon:yes gene_type:complete
MEGKKHIKMELLTLIILVTIVLVFWFMAMASQEGRAIGLVDGQLARCSEKPNCVCSEYPDDQEHFIEPFVIPDSFDNPEQVSHLIKGVLEKAGGKVQIQSNSYLSAIFESRFLGFVDDVEVRIDMSSKRVYLRSASRVGYSDLGANRNRATAIYSLLDKQTTTAF